jgi:DNA-binding transcriptional MerR regulator
MEHRKEPPGYRVEELAAATGVGVDTIRFYQGRGLLDSPERRGRVAWYDEAHVERLRRIRKLQGQGFTLAQIRRVLVEPEPEGPESLLAALVDAGVGARTLTLDELSAEAGVPKVLIRGAIDAGLIEPLQLDGDERFSESDLEMVRVGLSLLEAGFPLPTLLQEAVRHAEHMQETCDAAIELFDAHVRKRGPAAGDMEAITAIFQRLFPLATRLVAVHLQRTLVTRALRRLQGTEEADALQAALTALETARLEVDVAWR